MTLRRDPILKTMSATASQPVPTQHRQRNKKEKLQPESETSNNTSNNVTSSNPATQQPQPSSEQAPATKSELLNVVRSEPQHFNQWVSSVTATTLHDIVETLTSAEQDEVWKLVFEMASVVAEKQAFLPADQDGKVDESTKQAAYDAALVLSAARALASSFLEQAKDVKRGMSVPPDMEKTVFLLHGACCYAQSFNLER